MLQVKGVFFFFFLPFHHLQNPTRTKMVLDVLCPGRGVGREVAGGDVRSRSLQGDSLASTTSSERGAEAAGREGPDKGPGPRRGRFSPRGVEKWTAGGAGPLSPPA